MVITMITIYYTYIMSHILNICDQYILIYKYQMT